MSNYKKIITPIFLTPLGYAKEILYYRDNRIIKRKIEYLNKLGGIIMAKRKAGRPKKKKKR